ncbi:hypothetical protein [Lentzea sp. NBRC 102530]|uniref:hypothetical protein n=1 Tax=Lentzea sp. NBRC 102530 TaxID=3032201 RepID=UPI0024A465F3|nr:hypothetical protein [Lentzea sp. NBRC 102530]GLY55326.1 hypothetical protein Lesp01_89810 [Lentzea sp. NBRC 102530]
MTAPAPNFDNNAFEMLTAQLRAWGLESLTQVVRGMLVAGDTGDVIPIKLRQTAEYKERFSGNELRRRAGYAALSEAEYLSIEGSYKSIVRQYVGAGTYDTKDNFDKWMATNTSPVELNQRFESYRAEYDARPQAWKDMWAAQGFTPADAIRTVADPSVTEADLKRKLSAYSITGEAYSAYSGYQFDLGRAEELASYGVTAEQARKGFQDVSQRQRNDEMLFTMSGDSTNRTELENEALLNDQSVGARRRKAAGEEQARFSENYLGVQQGGLSRQSSGQY